MKYLIIDIRFIFFQVNGILNPLVSDNLKFEIEKIYHNIFKVPQYNENLRSNLLSSYFFFVTFIRFNYLKLLIVFSSFFAPVEFSSSSCLDHYQGQFFKEYMHLTIQILKLNSYRPETVRVVGQNIQHF